MRPLASMLPPVGGNVPQISCSKVVLPEPLRPMMPTVSPFLISNDTSLSAQNSRKYCLGVCPAMRCNRGGDKLLEPITLVVVNLVALAEVADADGGVGHTEYLPTVLIFIISKTMPDKSIRIDPSTVLRTKGLVEMRSL